MAGDSPRPARPPALPAALGLVPFLLRSLRLPCPPRAAFGRRASRPNGRLEAPISGRQGASPGAALANRRGPRPRVAGGSTRAAAAAEEQLASQQPASRREVGAWRRGGRRPRAEGGSGGGLAVEGAAVRAAGRAADARLRGGGAARARASSPPPSPRAAARLRPLPSSPSPPSTLLYPPARRGRRPGPGLGAGREDGGRECFQFRLQSPIPLFPSQPPPSHRKRKEQKVPDPLDLTGRDPAPPCR